MSCSTRHYSPPGRGARGNRHMALRLQHRPTALPDRLVHTDEFASTFTPRRSLALRYANDSAQAPAQQGKTTAGNELKTVKETGATSVASHLCLVSYRAQGVRVTRLGTSVLRQAKGRVKSRQFSSHRIRDWHRAGRVSR